MALAGIAVVALLAPSVLPERQSPRRGLAAARDFVVRMIVESEGPLAGRSVGLVVDEIHDIVEQALEMQSHTAVHGIAGSAVIQGRVTDVLDIHGVLRRALAGLFAEVAA